MSVCLSCGRGRPFHKPLIYRCSLVCNIPQRLMAVAPGSCLMYNEALLVVQGAMETHRPGQANGADGVIAGRLRAAASAASENYAKRNARSREIAGEAARYLPGGNTRTTLWYDPFPLCMVRGAG